MYFNYLYFNYYTALSVTTSVYLSPCMDNWTLAIFPLRVWCFSMGTYKAPHFLMNEDHLTMQHMTIKV